MPEVNVRIKLSHPMHQKKISTGKMPEYNVRIKIRSPRRLRPGEDKIWQIFGKFVRIKNSDFGSFRLRHPSVLSGVLLGLPYDFGTCSRELKLNELSAKISRSECKHESLRDHFWVMDSVTINDLASGVSATRLQPELIRSKKRCLRCSTCEVYICIQHTAAIPNQHHL